MMKKLCLLLFFVSLFGFLAFGDTGEQEEIDFLLFLHNSANRFVNEESAMIQLDNTAIYLMARNLSPGRISVHGYAAAAVNDIEPYNLSRERALHVISELQKRGLSGDLFAEPVAYGQVDLWGGNADERDRSLNRRVRILLDDSVLTMADFRTVCTWEETETVKTCSKFPWWIIPLALLGIALIAAIIFFASASRRKETSTAEKKIYILTEDEIRRHAYGLHRQRNGQSEDAVEDWHHSIRELTAHHEAQGYEVISYWEL